MDTKVFKSKFTFRLLPITIFFFALNFCEEVKGNTNLSIFDLTGYDLGNTKPVKLKGLVDFYSGELLEPYEIDDHLYSKKTKLNLPRSWRKNGDVPNLGFGTYDFLIKLSGNQKNVSIYFPLIHSSSKILIDGEIASVKGSVSKEPDSNYKPRIGEQLVPIKDFAKEVRVTIQVANFSYFSGGIFRSPILQQNAEALRTIDITHGILNFFVGSLIAMFLYQIVLFAHHKNDRSYLWLSLICLTIGIRSWTTNSGSLFLHDLFPEVHPEYWWKLEFFCVYVCTALVPLYVRSLFPLHSKVWPLYLFIPVSCFICLPILFFPQYIYGFLLDICHITLVLAFLYMIYSSTRAVLAGNKEAKIIFKGILISIPFTFMEIAQNSLLLEFSLGIPFLVELGLLIFLGSQLFLLANRYETSYTSLKYLNQNLEVIVEKRTDELIKSNEVKDKLFSIISHDVKSPLNTLKSTLDVFHKEYLTKDEVVEVLKKTEGELNKTTLLLENLLAWSSNQLKGITVKIQTFNLQEIIVKNIELFDSNIKQKNLTVNLLYQEDVYVSSDKNIIDTVFRNLIANAIKFSFNNGTIEVDINKDLDQICLYVQDYGIGMDKKTADSIGLQGKSIINKGTSDELGTGLGLQLCQEYISKVGKLEFYSRKNIGSRFTIIIPN